MIHHCSEAVTNHIKWLPMTKYLVFHLKFAYERFYLNLQIPCHLIVNINIVSYFFLVPEEILNGYVKT